MHITGGSGEMLFGNRIGLAALKERKFQQHKNQHEHILSMI